jgi:D-alanyl-D-alanine carboxypeptidase/D-alanyl-D-alanine-endopeptidase (penicillin-binding protein 4)
MTRSRLRFAGGVAVVAVLFAGAGVGGYAGTHAVRDQQAGPPCSAALPSAYAAAESAPATRSAPPPAPPAVPAAVARALRTVVAARGLGARLRARIIDVATGQILYDRGGTDLAAPASTAKLLTAAAVLSVRPADYRIKTTVVAGASGAVVLVGGGDPTLTGARGKQPPAYPDAARISDLAAQLARAHVRPTRIVVDDSLFTGPAVSPAWAPTDVPSEYASAITAVLADGGRAAPGAVDRSAQPDLAAGRELAAAVGRPSVPVVRGHAPAAARVLATVASAPLSTLIEQMLLESDNVIAEALARQVAIAEHQPVSFTGSAAAIRLVLRGLGVDPGAGMVDGSGLAARDRLSPAALADVLRIAARAAGHPDLRTLLASLPVAGWSGTLVGRYSGGPAAGVVRAKTGTLTGVSALAGTVHDRSGRLLAFAFIADRTGPTAAAEAALDAVTTRLAACGCG